MLFIIKFIHKEKKMKRLTGIGASEGVSIGKVLLFVEGNIVIPQEIDANSTIEGELAKLENGLKKSLKTRTAFVLMIRKNVWFNRRLLLNASVN